MNLKICVNLRLHGEVTEIRREFFYEFHLSLTKISVNLCVSSVYLRVILNQYNCEIYG
jgi:hypothetical protein